MEKVLKELIVVKGKVIEQTKSYSPNAGREINYEVGAKMIKRHFDENSDDVIAHFTGKNKIEAILNQPGCVGIRTFYGLNELGIRTMIFVGVDKEGNNLVSSNRTINSTNGIIISHGHSCPPTCGADADTPSKDGSGWM